MFTTNNTHTNTNTNTTMKVHIISTTYATRTLIYIYTYACGFCCCTLHFSQNGKKNNNIISLSIVILESIFIRSPFFLLILAPSFIQYAFFFSVLIHLSFYLHPSNKPKSNASCRSLGD
ncbi:hypothetical protein EDC94DRAFT_619555 [Helicostylum pulchrum]|nr:hypothetical protein EDC94DRAFT_619555 [Helicostylum pulchrum]